MVILVILVILVVRQMVAAAKLDGREAFLPMVAAAKFVVATADGPSGACYGRRGWALRGMFFLVLGQRTGGHFFVLGTYGGWVETLGNPLGTLEAPETLVTLCVALCGDKLRTNFPTSQWATACRGAAAARRGAGRRRRRGGGRSRRLIRAAARRGAGVYVGVRNQRLSAAGR